MQSVTKGRPFQKDIPSALQNQFRLTEHIRSGAAKFVCREYQLLSGAEYNTRVVYLELFHKNSITTIMCFV